MSSDRAQPASSSHTHPLIDRTQVGARLRSIRKNQKLTLKQLSERSGVALSTPVSYTHLTLPTKRIV